MEEENKKLKRFQEEVDENFIPTLKSTKTMHVQSYTPTPYEIERAKEYMASGLTKSEAINKARSDIQSEAFHSYLEANKKNNSGCMVVLLIIIAPTILLSLAVL